MLLQTLTLHDLLIGIPHDGAALFIYALVLVSVAAVIKGSMNKSEPVAADWRSDEN